MEPTPIPAGLEKLLDLVIKKCDDSKKDLEKNWTYQIIAVGVSVGLIFGLGQAISKHYLDEVGHERVLYLVLPLINLYLFMRFGFLASIFSDARLALEQLATTYFKLVELKEIDPALTLGSSVLSTTNSYFEFYHRGRPNLGVFLYSLFCPHRFRSEPRIIVVPLGASGGQRIPQGPQPGDFDRLDSVPDPCAVPLCGLLHGELRPNLHDRWQAVQLCSLLACGMCHSDSHLYRALAKLR